MPPKPIGDRPMTGAERQAKFAARQAEIEARLETSRLETIEGLRARVAELEEHVEWLSKRLRRRLKK